MGQTFDYGVLYKSFSKIIKEQQELTMIEAGGVGQQPKPPFVIFDVISPHINIYDDHDVNERELFEAVVSFTLFSYTKLQALNLAENLRKLMYSDNSRSLLRKQEVIIVEVMPTNIRSIQNEDNDKFMVGFDMRLRLRDPFEDDIQVMDSIEVNET